MTNDPVNNPSHYGGVNNPYEHVKVMEAKLSRDQFIGAMIFQVTKYLDRLEKKEGADPHVDAAKAAWYANRLTYYLTPKPMQQAVAVAKPPVDAPFDEDMKPVVRVMADGGVVTMDSAAIAAALAQKTPSVWPPHGEAGPLPGVRRVPRHDDKGG